MMEGTRWRWRHLGNAERSSQSGASHAGGPGNYIWHKDSHKTYA